MCTRVHNQDTDRDAETQKELRDMLGGVALVKDGPVRDHCCLCQVDVEATVRAAGFDYAMVDSDPMDVIISKTLSKPI
jgi:hypothetical protein